MKKLIIFVLCMLFTGYLYSTDWNAGVEVSFGSSIPRPTLGIDLEKLYAGLACETRGSLFLSLNLGGAYNLTSRDLGSNLLFRVACGVGYQIGNHRITLSFDHISNAKLVDYNPGRDTIGIRYGYVF